MATEEIEVLVTVKAYPAISLKYGEVACVAGIRTDQGANAWTRLYPIAFRDMDFTRRFRKYSFITLQAEKHSTDTRPESMRPNTDSLAVGSKLDTKQGWRRRREIVVPLLSLPCVGYRLSKQQQACLSVLSDQAESRTWR